MLLHVSQEPTAFLCRGEFYADIVYQVAKELDKQLGRDLFIVSGGHTQTKGSAPYPQVLSTVEVSGQIRQLAELIGRQIHGSSEGPNSQLIDVKLCELNYETDEETI